MSFEALAPTRVIVGGNEARVYFSAEKAKKFCLVFCNVTRSRVVCLGNTSDESKFVIIGVCSFGHKHVDAKRHVIDDLMYDTIAICIRQVRSE